MSTSDPRITDINNEDCILVEFVNEDNKLQTGYLKWLKNYDDVNNIQEVIVNGEEVTIYWPDVDPSEANSMKKMKKKIHFKQHVVKVIERGEWTELRAQENNIIQFGHKGTSRANRHILKRRVVDNKENKNDLHCSKKIKNDSKNTVDKNTFKFLNKNRSSRVDLEFSDEKEEEENDKAQKKNNEQKNGTSDISSESIDEESTTN